MEVINVVEQEQVQELTPMTLTNEDKSNVAYQFVCIDCGKVVDMSPEEKAWYDGRKWVLPKRCEDCRYHNRKKREKLLRAKAKADKRKKAEHKNHYVLKVKISKDLMSSDEYRAFAEKLGQWIDAELNAANVDDVLKNDAGVAER